MGGSEFMSVRRWQAGVEWHPPAHSHTFCEIIVVLRGAHRADIGGHQFIAESGQVLFYPPGCIHQECQHGEALLDFLCCDFEWRDRPFNVPHLINDRQGRVREIVRWLVAEEHSGYSGRAAYQQRVTEMLVGELQRLVVQPPDDMLSVVCRYIHKNLEKPISLDVLATCGSLNKFHLSRVFRAETGMTPMEYVRNARLELAHRLLLETNLPLREIAPRVGLANEYHLSRLLKAHFGRGARDLRKDRYDAEIIGD